MVVWLLGAVALSAMFWENLLIIGIDEWFGVIRGIYVIIAFILAWYCITYEFKKES